MSEGRLPLDEQPGGKHWLEMNITGTEGQVLAREAVGSTMTWLSPMKRGSRSYQLWLINHNSVSNLMTGKMILTVVGFQGCVYLTKDPL